MATETATRNLLFGLLALQNGLIDQDQLIAAFRAWTRDKSQPIADLLADRGDLDSDQGAAVEALLALHLRKHGNDPEKSLAAMVAGRLTRERLNQIGDPDVEASATLVGSRSNDDSVHTPTFLLGSATSEGQRFRVLRPHAHGGLGTVFVALDEELHREVALKEILERHADDPVSRQRFLIEAEITGGLEHPGIVPVYGLGTYAGGRPYYAMRFIKGDSLKEAIKQFHADASLRNDPGRRSLELRKLLRRFTDVCNAIGYAHSRGVLHRDIKPGNVIVGKHGETLVVDWGLAKALGTREPGTDGEERTLVPSSGGGSVETSTGGLLGTPAYMSPEQAAGQLDKLGCRSDVYSLGATLYTLLTGKAPFAGDVGTVLRRVQAGAFPLPRALDPSIDRALEAVCLKGMAVRPDDRYATPKALTDDVERWLADEPVTAWREPLARCARRWMRRNRPAVTGAAAAVLAGVIGLVAVVVVQTRAKAKLKDAYDATARALAESKESLSQANAVTKFLVESLRSPDPSLDGRKILVVDLLDRTAGGLDKEFTGTEATRGKLLDSLGQTYHGLGLRDKAVATFAKARAVCEAALGPNHRDTLTSRHNLANSYLAAGRTSEAIKLLEETLKRRELTLGPNHRDTLTSRNSLALAYQTAGRTSEAIKLLEETLKRRELTFGPDDADTLTSRNNLAESYRAAGRTNEAIQIHEETLKRREAKFRPDHPDTLQSRNNLGLTYYAAGRTNEAIAMHEETLKLFQLTLGPDHPDTLVSRNNLAMAYYAAGRMGEAIRMDEETLKLKELKLALDHPSTLGSRHNLANSYLAAGRTNEAIAMHQETLKRIALKFDPDHPNALTSRNSLAVAYYAAGRMTEAIPILEDTVKRRDLKLGPNHLSTLNSRNSLATAYEALGRWDEAERLRRETLARRRKTDKPDSPLLAGDLAGLGANLLDRAKWPEAESVVRECLAIRAKVVPDDWSRFYAMSLLGGARLGQGKYADAEPLVVPGYEGMKAREAKIPALGKPFLARAGQRVVRLYEAWGKPEQAAAWKEKLGLADLPADVFAK